MELVLCGGRRAVKQGAVLEAGAVPGSLGQRGELIVHRAQVQPVGQEDVPPCPTQMKSSAQPQMDF